MSRQNKTSHMTKKAKSAGKARNEYMNGAIKTSEKAVLMGARTIPYTSQFSLCAPASLSRWTRYARMPSTMTEQISWKMRRATRAPLEMAFISLFLSLLVFPVDTTKDVRKFFSPRKLPVSDT